MRPPDLEEPHINFCPSTWPADLGRAEEVFLMKPGMTNVCHTIELLMNQDLDPSKSNVVDYLWDFTIDRDVELAQVVKECEEIIAFTENFRRYLKGQISPDAMLGIV
jgi:hypothetical protein